MGFAAAVAAGMGIWAGFSTARAAVQGEESPLKVARQMYGVPSLFDIYGFVTGDTEKQEHTPRGFIGAMEDFAWTMQWENLTILPR
jgi:hypothetical protein